MKMLKFEITTQLFILNLIYLSSQYIKIVKGGYPISISHKESNKWLLFSNFGVKFYEEVTRIKYPFNSVSFIKLETYDFWSHILHIPTFDLITDLMSKKIDRKSDLFYQDILFFKITKPFGELKFAKIFTNNKQLASPQDSQIKQLPDDTNDGFEERLQNFLKSNFPFARIEILEIFVNDLILRVSLSKIYFGESEPIFNFDITIFFDLEKALIKPARDEASSRHHIPRLTRSLLVGEESLSSVLSTFIKPNSPMIIFNSRIETKITIDYTEGSEKKIMWEFLTNRKRDTGFGNNTSNEIGLEYAVYLREQFIDPNCFAYYAGIPLYTSLLQWQNFYFKKNMNTMTAIEIIESYFENRNTFLSVSNSGAADPGARDSGVADVVS